MWAVEKVSRSEEEKNFFNLPSAKIKHSANEPICRVPDKNILFAECH